MEEERNKPSRGYLKPPGLVKPLDWCCEVAQEGRKHVVQEFTVPAKSGNAWKVLKGQTCRFSLPEGPQVGDVNLWNLHDFKEHFYSGKTRQLHQAHVSIGDRLWSNFPYLHPMATIVADSLAGYTPDSDGCGVHDLLGTRCDPYTYKLITGSVSKTSCHQILTQAVESWDLKESDVHDVFNIFLCTGIDKETHEFLMKGTPAEKGDYIEILAEMDLLVALSVCPSGDVSIPIGQPVPDHLCHPIDITIADCTTVVWLFEDQK